MPYWQDCRRLLQGLQQAGYRGPGLPPVHQLQKLLPDHARNQAGKALTFVPSLLIPGARYEEHIFRSGEVSTRENNWHDLFNALVWALFPRLKSAMNALHYRELRRHGALQRGPVRDALTLFDECGVIVVSADATALERLARRDWDWVFHQAASLWQHDIQVFVCGHALLEKFLEPYKSLTAHALLVRLDSRAAQEPRESLRRILDLRLAEKLLAGSWLDSPAGLSPLPLMGIPGWWPRAKQNEAFYSDRQVFRPPAAGFSAAPVFDLNGNHQEIP